MLPETVMVDSPPAFDTRISDNLSLARVTVTGPLEKLCKTRHRFDVVVEFIYQAATQSSPESVTSREPSANASFVFRA